MDTDIWRQSNVAPFTNMVNFNLSMDKLSYPLKCGMKSLIHSQTSAVQPLKFESGYVISSHTLLDIWLLIHAGI